MPKRVGSWQSGRKLRQVTHKGTQRSSPRANFCRQQTSSEQQWHECGIVLRHWRLLKGVLRVFSEKILVGTQRSGRNPATLPTARAVAVVDQAVVSGASFVCVIMVGRFSDIDQLGRFAPRNDGRDFVDLCTRCTGLPSLSHSGEDHAALALWSVTSSTSESPTRKELSGFSGL